MAGGAALDAWRRRFVDGVSLRSEVAELRGSGPVRSSDLLKLPAPLLPLSLEPVRGRFARTSPSSRPSSDSNGRAALSLPITSSTSAHSLRATKARRAPVSCRRRERSSTSAGATPMSMSVWPRVRRRVPGGKEGRRPMMSEGGMFRNGGNGSGSRSGGGVSSRTRMFRPFTILLSRTSMARTTASGPSFWIVAVTRRIWIPLSSYSGGCGGCSSREATTPTAANKILRKWSSVVLVERFEMRFFWAG